jgi:hypothetical protein
VTLLLYAREEHQSRNDGEMDDAIAFFGLSIKDLIPCSAKMSRQTHLTSDGKLQLPQWAIPKRLSGFCVVTEGVAKVCSKLESSQHWDSQPCRRRVSQPPKMSARARFLSPFSLTTHGKRGTTPSRHAKVHDACRTRTCAPEGNRFLVYRYNHSAKAPE